jgi:hypothetical protein
MKSKKDTKKFKVYTSKESKFVPDNIFCVRNEYGWLTAAQIEGKWYMNAVDEAKGKIDIETLMKHFKNQLDEQTKAKDSVPV